MSDHNRNRSYYIFKHKYLIYIGFVVNIGVFLLFSYINKQALLNQKNFDYVYASDEVEEYSATRGTTKVYLRIRPAKKKPHNNQKPTIQKQPVATQLPIIDVFSSLYNWFQTTFVNKGN